MGNFSQREVLIFLAVGRQVVAVQLRQDQLPLLEVHRQEILAFLVNQREPMGAYPAVSQQRPLDKAIMVEQEHHSLV